MEDKENLEAFDNLTPIWDSLPINISWQIFHRDNDEFSRWELSVQQIKIGINMSILLNASCMIEGYLEEKIRLMYSSKYKSALNDFEKRQQKSFLHSVNNATFSKYNDLYKLVSGLEIKEIIGSPNAELWKDITKLFEIRNIIAHSQSIETNIDLTKGTETAAAVIYKGKFKMIVEYFKKSNLLENPIPEDLYFKEILFGDTSTDYLYNQAKEFIICLDKELGAKGYPKKPNLCVIFKPIDSNIKH